MPTSDDGRRRLRDALREVDEHVEQPLAVWWWDAAAGQEARGVLYGFGAGVDGRRALVVARPGGDGEHALWIPAVLVRRRRE